MVIIDISYEYGLMSHFKSLAGLLIILILNHLKRFLDFLLYYFYTFDILKSQYLYNFALYNE